MEEVLKDFGGRIVGYIETFPNGDKVGKDFYRRIVGYYEVSSNTTKDFYRRVVGRGDMLSALVWNSKK